MESLWSGYGIPAAANMTWTDVFVPQSTSVVLGDIPGMVTRVLLPTTTHAVCLWSLEASVWYALDAIPGPIPAPAMGSVVAATAFRLGGVLLPGAWQLFVLPDDSLAHELQLVSQSSSPLVIVTALTEML